MKRFVLAGLLLFSGLFVIAFPGESQADLLFEEPVNIQVDPLSPTGGGGGRWRTFCVDCPRAIKGISERGMITDNNGRPHIAYGTDNIYYAWHDGTQWHSEIAASPGRVDHFSIAVDQNNQPYISYWHDDTDSLRMTYRDINNNWRTDIVDANGYVGQYSSIAVDSKGAIHIAYYDFGVGQLRYVKKTASGWTFPFVVDGSGGVGWNASLALDSNDVPHITYYDNINHLLKYTYQISSTNWHIETISSQTSYYSSLAIDNNDNIFVTYLYIYEAPDYQLKFGHRTASGWQVETVVSAFHLAPHSSLKIDDFGHPHIAYYEDISSANVNEVKYATRNITGWVTEKVAESEVAGFPSIALDNYNRPHIAYYDNWLFGNKVGNLQVARRINSNWIVDKVDSSWRGGHHADLRIDQNDYPRMVYEGAVFPEGQGIEDVNGGGGGGLSSVVYTQWTGSQWEEQKIGEGYSPRPTLALDANNTPHIVFSAYTGYENSVLTYAKQVGQTWVTNVVGSGLNGHIVLDKTNQPHVAYSDITYPYTPTYARWNGNSWSRMPLTGEVGSVIGFALDNKDFPYLLYKEWDSSIAKLAYWNGIAWVIKPLHLNDDSAEPSLVLSSTGEPQVSYCTSQGLFYGVLQSYVWYVELLDFRPCLTNTVIAVDSADNLGIAYIDEEYKSLQYISRVNGYWTTEGIAPVVADGQTYVGQKNSLQFDGFDNPYVAYYDAYNDDLKLAGVYGGIGSPRVYLPAITNNVTRYNSSREVLESKANYFTGTFPHSFVTSARDVCIEGDCALSQRVDNEFTNNGRYLADVGSNEPGNVAEGITVKQHRK